MTLRGFSAISDQFVDGFRDDALYFRDMSNVDRIEVLKGPAAVRHGRGSSGGLINRVTKRPGINHSEMAVRVGRHNQRGGEVDLARAAGEGGMACAARGEVDGAVSVLRADMSV